ncbi:MAG: plasmid mobilization relaxosome protein MobC, partial [Albidovulum sp.]
TSAAQPVAARVSPAELQAFDAAIDRAGLRSRSDGLRALVRMASGFLEFSREENVQLDDLTRALGKVGVNINQLARLANSGRLPLNGRQFDELAELGRGIRQLRSFLGQMNTERRRRGTALFEKHREADHG